MADNPKRDTIFDKPLSSVKSFKFDRQVVSVFDDMINRSVPGYALLGQLMALYADVFVQNNSRVYDLGCSTGIMTRVLAEQSAERRCQIVAVDNSAAMIEQCKQAHDGLAVDWLCADIEAVEITQASLVVLNLTLQFIPRRLRDDLVQRIYRGLIPGGALVLTEKVISEDPTEQRVITDLYQGFKKIQGYSDLEIANKRSALDKVLVPEPKSEHLRRLHACGFAQVHDVFHCLNFVSLLAVKNGS